MSRPPKPVSESKRPMAPAESIPTASAEGQARGHSQTPSRRGGAHCPLSRLAEAVGPREALRQEADEQGSRQSDDVQVIAVDALDQRRAEPLDRVAARARVPLSASDVVSDVARRHLTERHARDLTATLLPRARQQTEA